MDKSISIKHNTKLKRRKHVRDLSSINLNNQIENIHKTQDKQHLLPIINSRQVSLKKIDKYLNVSMKNPLFKNSDDQYLKLNRIFQRNLYEKIRDIPKNNEDLLIQAHLQVLKEIIKIDVFGSILEKIYLQITSFISHISRQETSFTGLTQEIEVNHLKDQIKNLELSKKSIDQKLKKLSIENIDLLLKIDNLEEENLLLKDYKKNIKIIDGVPDTTPILKELRSKSTILDSLSKKQKVLSKKEKILNLLIKALKEKGLKARDLLNSYSNEHNSNDSINLSQISFYSNASHLN